MLYDTCPCQGHAPPVSEPTILEEDIIVTDTRGPASEPSVATANSDEDAAEKNTNPKRGRPPTESSGDSQDRRKRAAVDVAHKDADLSSAAVSTTVVLAATPISYIPPAAPKPRNLEDVAPWLAS